MSSHYTYRVAWSPDDGEYVGTCLEFPSLSHLDPDPSAAVSGVVDLVQFVVDELIAAGEPVPAGLADRSYSGRFVVRTSADLHRRLTIEAAERGVSINKWVNEKLATTVRSIREVSGPVGDGG